MKKTFKPLIILIIISLISINSFLFLSNNITLNASEMDITNKNGLGYSINCVKHHDVIEKNIIVDHPILDLDFLSQIISDIEVMYCRTSDVVNYNVNSIKNIQNNLDILKDVRCDQYPSQVHYVLDAAYINYTYNLPAYLTYVSEYKNNLNSDFQNALKELFENDTQEKANEFFDMYGTHMIGK